MGSNPVRITLFKCMNKKYCLICGELIPEGRLKAIPNTETCVLHSTTERKRGFRVITGKNTYTELDIVDEKSFKDLTKYDRKNHSASHMVFHKKSAEDHKLE